MGPVCLVPRFVVRAHLPPQEMAAWQAEGAVETRGDGGLLLLTLEILSGGWRRETGAPLSAEALKRAAKRQAKGQTCLLPMGAVHLARQCPRGDARG